MKTYKGTDASPDYIKVMETVKRKGFETFHEYRQARGLFIPKSEPHIKTRYEELPAGAKPVPQCPGYYATEYGEIWKYSDKLGAWIMLSQQSHKSGYLACQPYVNDKRKVKYVHRLVASAFYGDMGIDYDVHHINADRHDNNIDNLQWVERDRHRRMKKMKK